MTDVHKKPLSEWESLDQEVLDQAVQDIYLGMDRYTREEAAALEMDFDRMYPANQAKIPEADRKAIELFEFRKKMEERERRAAEDL
mmetsp:Transcript_19714/g.30433  ORF Transcript_19714/g.30433 Transcript_19714/m.30433 type:complete len:86 (+) Transcript_19714:1597-1854(+)